jgi:VWFA-related protein
MGNRLVSHYRCFIAIALLVNLCVAAAAQDKEKPKIKHFGSSLKRIKWNEEKKAAVDITTKSSSNEDSEDIDVVKVETSLVSNDVLVLDPRGNMVTGLTEKDFLIDEDGSPQTVGHFSTGDSASVPRSIVLIIDYSGSQFPFIKTSVAAAKALVDKLPAADSMAIVTDDVELIQDFTKDNDKLKKKLDSLLSKVHPDTPLGAGFTGRRLGLSKQYSALFATLREAFSGEDQRPIVIFQTDGDQIGQLRNTPLPPREIPGQVVDKATAELRRKMYEETRTDFSLDDIYRAAEKARTTIYTVVPGKRLMGRPLEDVIADTKIEAQKMFASFPLRDERLKKMMEAATTNEALKVAAEGRITMQKALESVATQTGGWTMFLETPDDADRIYSSIFSDINRRYIVGYYPTNKEHDGKRRKVEITVGTHPEYFVVGRKWYYAPNADQ